MKKYFSLILVLVLAFAMAVSAFAADGPIKSGSGSADKGIEAGFTAGKNVSSGKVYYVTVEWTSKGDLMYTEGNTTYTWNTSTLTYDEDNQGAGTWTGTATVDVKVTNKSNDAIEATATWENSNNITSAACAFTNGGVMAIGSADEGVLPGSEMKGTEKTGTTTAKKTTTKKTTTKSKTGTTRKKKEQA